MIQEEKKRYSEEDLKEFAELIGQKLEATRSELNYIKETLSKRNDSGTDNTSGNSKLLEDGADTSERENLSQLAARLQKFTQQLDAAMVRIKNGTYGICKDTGKLIPRSGCAQFRIHSKPSKPNYASRAKAQTRSTYIVRKAVCGQPFFVHDIFGNDYNHPQTKSAFFSR